MAYAVVNLDRMSGTEDSSQLLSVRFFDDNDEPAAIENGNVVVYGDLITYNNGGVVTQEREVRKATTPAGTETLAEIALVANPELIYDESRRHPLDDYINEAGQEIRAYRLHQNDGFSVTAEAFSGTPEKGKYVVLGATTKLVVSGTATGTVIGKIDDVFTLGRHTYYYVVVSL